MGRGGDERTRASHEAPEPTLDVATEAKERGRRQEAKNGSNASNSGRKQPSSNDNGGGESQLFGLLLWMNKENDETRNAP